MKDSYRTFIEETAETGKAYTKMIESIAKTSALDKKTHELAYIAVLSSCDMTEGLYHHVLEAKELGASRDEVKSAVLLGLPVVGSPIIEALAVALQEYDKEKPI